MGPVREPAARKAGRGGRGSTRSRRRTAEERTENRARSLASVPVGFGRVRVSSPGLARQVCVGWRWWRGAWKGGPGSWGPGPELAVNEKGWVWGTQRRVRRSSKPIWTGWWERQGGAAPFCAAGGELTAAELSQSPRETSAWEEMGSLSLVPCP